MHLQYNNGTLIFLYFGLVPNDFCGKVPLLGIERSYSRQSSSIHLPCDNHEILHQVGKVLAVKVFHQTPMMPCREADEGAAMLVKST